MPQAPIIFTGFPIGYCYPSNPTQLIMDAIGLMYANVPSNVTGVVYGTTPPGDTSTTRLFYSSITHRLYEYSDFGVWLSLYWPDPSANIRMITEMNETQIKAWDNPGAPDAVGGTAGQWTGPFWEIDHAYDGRFVIGPNGTTILVGATGGSATTPIAVGNLPAHRHEITIGPESGLSSYLPPVGTENGTFKVNGAEQIRFYDLASTEIGRTRMTGGQTEGVGPITPVDIMPPYRAACIVKRTPRLYYTL